MLKAIGSRKAIGEDGGALAAEFYSHIADLVDTEEVRRLLEVSQHMDVTRFQHSLNVAYYSFLLCRKWGLDARAAARGGLLHDLFYYELKDFPIGVRHIKFHPREALRNAGKLCKLTKKEENIIASHMWPMGLCRPKYMESYITSLADKYCATFEASKYIAGIIRRTGRSFLGSEG